ncbi:MAG: hypothetical protein ACLGGV_05800 [Bacteroidia bacterium]
MKRNKFVNIQKLLGLALGVTLCVSSVRANEDANKSKESTIAPSYKKGKALFEGSTLFKNGGPSCITCHNVKNDNVAPGGLLAKDLTDVYSRMGEGLGPWLSAPPFPAMISSYQNNPIEEEERAHLTAFLKQVNDVKDSQSGEDKGKFYQINGGIIGLVVLLILVQILWSNRKRKMVKKDIFKRQIKAFDAKY